MGTVTFPVVGRIERKRRAKKYRRKAQGLVKGKIKARWQASVGVRRHRGEPWVLKENKMSSEAEQDRSFRTQGKFRDLPKGRLRELPIGPSCNLAHTAPERTSIEDRGGKHPRVYGQLWEGKITCLIQEYP